MKEEKKDDTNKENKTIQKTIRNRKNYKKN